MASTEKSQILSFVVPTATREYSQDYMNSFVRTLELYFQSLQEVGNIRGSTINLSSLPTNIADLRNGDVYIDPDGFLKIKRSDDNFTTSLSGSVGSVTVVIS